MALSPIAVRELYRRRAPHYDRSLILLRLSGFGEKRYRRRAVGALHLSPGDTVVDLGCGTGRNLPLLRAAVGAAGRVIGVDLTDAMLAQARRRIAAAGWTNVALVEGDAAAYAYPPGVRGILATFALTLSPDYEQAVARAAAALEPGGRLAVLDLKLPERWPGWLVRLAARANAPYGVSLDLADRHVWEAVRSHLCEERFEEYYGGAVYLSVGRQEGGG